MSDFDKYIKQGEPTQVEKANAWQVAIGLQAVDGLQTSNYLKKTAQKHIEGGISIDQARELINNYYEIKSERGNEKLTEQADRVAVNIAKILGEKNFNFSYQGLLATHKNIFDGVFDFAGTPRSFDITKKEWILNGDTVYYVNFQEIEQTVEYDLARERAFSYKNLSQKQIIEHFAEFVRGLWQIHPFQEGNTRTTAVFAIKYLRTLGFKVDNQLFEEYSLYFRNALVRASYSDIPKNIVKENEYLIKFFNVLLTGTPANLSSREMLIAPENFSEQ